MQEEDRFAGAVGWETYKGYMKAAGGYHMILLAFLTYVLVIGSLNFNNWWLSTDNLKKPLLQPLTNKWLSEVSNRSLLMCDGGFTHHFM